MRRITARTHACRIPRVTGLESVTFHNRTKIFNMHTLRVTQSYIYIYIHMLINSTELSSIVLYACIHVYPRIIYV